MNRAVAQFVTSLDPPAGGHEAALPALWKIVDAAVRRWAAMAVETRGNALGAAHLRSLPVMSAETAEVGRQALYAIVSSMSGLCPAAVHNAIGALNPAQGVALATPNLCWSMISTSATWAARTANNAGDQAIKEARKLAFELSVNFKG